ncbi:hypothetical protein F5Y19DRAFT_446484 [Xylariaceae sp. FL1651]|nr:hypothetical protein F5Y19DRAFT_446484 [Xylariaceae sp. FL1651]
MLSLCVLWLFALSAQGQRIRVNEPTGPALVDGDTNISTGESIPDEAMIGKALPKETEQVARNQTGASPSNPPSEPVVPISAILFDGSPGPKDCRGNVILNVGLTKPGAQHSTPTCYNVPGVAQCGNFLANKADGCQARVFNEPNCLTFANIAVFIPETRAFGGYIRSIEITCGVVSKAPPPLNLPGLQLPSNAQQAVG